MGVERRIRRGVLLYAPCIQAAYTVFREGLAAAYHLILAVAGQIYTAFVLSISQKVVRTGSLQLLFEIRFSSTRAMVSDRVPPIHFETLTEEPCKALSA